MASAPARPLWKGRVLVLLGIVLVAVGLRTAVAALSPIYSMIDADLHGGTTGLGLLGTLPPLCFAAFGLLAPALSRRFGVEGLLIVSLVLLAAGHLVRGIAGDFTTLVVGSILCFAGIGLGNVLLPPLVKTYFPDRIGLLTSVYATVMSLSTFIPPLVAVPLAEASSWHLSLGIWTVLAVLAVAPWIAHAVVERRAPVRTAEIPLPLATEVGRVRVTRSPTAWAIVITFGTSSVTAYCGFALLPTLLHDLAGVDAATGGILLSLFGFMGLPAAVIVPLLTARMRNTAVLVWIGVAFLLVGYAGLLIAPAAAPWLWVAIVGSGPLLFPLALALINLRTRTSATTIATSGFVQGLGYTIAAVFPLVVSWLHALTDGWIVPLVVLLVTAVPAIGAGIVLSRGRTVDEELAVRR